MFHGKNNHFDVWKHAGEKVTTELSFWGKSFSLKRLLRGKESAWACCRGFSGIACTEMQEIKMRTSPAYRKKEESEKWLYSYITALGFSCSWLCSPSIQEWAVMIPGGPWANGCLKFSPALTSRSTPSFNKGPEQGHGHPFIFLLLFVNISEAVRQPFREQCLIDPWMTEVCSIAGNSSDGSGLDTMACICHCLLEYVLTETGNSLYMNHSVHAETPY